MRTCAAIHTAFLVSHVLFSDARSRHCKRKTTLWKDSCSVTRRAWLMRRRKLAEAAARRAAPVRRAAPLAGDVRRWSAHCPRTRSTREARAEARGWWRACCAAWRGRRRPPSPAPRLPNPADHILLSFRLILIFLSDLSIFLKILRRPRPAAPPHLAARTAP
ncbi:hypothetical protein EVAR_22368_1 [Eumeta japonica]|uniref:Uncharacterized protein n=1 Tax=Eumeta variegata TaxID=151549 RepID=A0A4C1VJF5_EUMVA|nr:hypothetical protein EVAR_22368_1 [Eumeta japonica]